MSMSMKDQFVKISCEHNGKRSNVSWKHIKKSTFSTKRPKMDNVAIVTGSRSNITVVDIDFTKEDSYETNPFYEQFGDVWDETDTYVVKTVSGGFHLYYTYDAEVKQTQNCTLNLDIRNDGGYVVAPPSTINGKYYTQYNSNEIKEMPKEMKTWLLMNMYKQKRIRSKDAPKREVSMQTSTSSVIVSKDELRAILDKLPVDTKEKANDYRGDGTKWFLTGLACKFTGYFDVFDEWSKKTIHGNYDQNITRTWNGFDAGIENFIWLLNVEKKTKNTFTYKRIPGSVQFDSEINRSFLDTKKVEGKISLPIERFFQQGTNYVVKSGTGTGKTSAFIRYVTDNDLKFISIVSRVCLGQEQKRNLTRENIDAKLYLTDDYKWGDNIIITPESCPYIQSYDVSDYVIFLDEFNSIVEHVVTSSTLDNNRIDVMETLRKLITNCSQFICVDADISFIAMRYLEQLGVDFKSIVNINNNYAGTLVQVINDENEFYNLVKKQDKFILCTDSKNTAEIANMKTKIGDDDIKLITSDMDPTEDINLDEYEKVIYSPKIIYGLDSQMNRVVFGHYKNHTISPPQMVQQLTRCRNIKKVYLFVEQKTSKAPFFNNQELCKDEIDRCVTTYKKMCKDFIKNDLEAPPISVLTFWVMSYLMNYKLDCYDTNKFLHLIDILQRRGFSIFQDPSKMVKRANAKEKKAILETVMSIKVDEFDPNCDAIQTLNNRIMKIPEDKLSDYKELLCDTNVIERHFRSCDFLFKEIDELKTITANQKDFDMSKMRQSIPKLLFLYKLMDAIGIKYPSQYKYNDNDVKGHKELQTMYKSIFRARCKLDFSKSINVYKKVCSELVKMCGKDLFIVVQKNKTKTQPKHRIYETNPDVVEFHEKLYHFRQRCVRVPLVTLPPFKVR